MLKILKFKLCTILSNRLIYVLTLFALLSLNVEVIVNSGILFSGGGSFNTELKYILITNNYQLVAAFYGMLMAIILGTCTIGPDLESGNIYIIMSAYPYKCRYYTVSLISSWIYIFGVQILLFVNALIIYFIFDVSFLWSDLKYVIHSILLNCYVITGITAAASALIKGYASGIVGTIGYFFYNIYEFNEIPMINQSFILDCTQYKNVLCNILPISHILVPSITDESIIETYRCIPLIPNFHLYQILYISVAYIVGCQLFKNKELM